MYTNLAASSLAGIECDATVKLTMGIGLGLIKIIILSLHTAMMDHDVQNEMSLLLLVLLYLSPIRYSITE